MFSIISRKPARTKAVRRTSCRHQPSMRSFPAPMSGPADPPSCRRARRGDPGAQLSAAGDPGRRPSRRRLVGAVPDRRHRAAIDHHLLRRALHGRDRQDPLAREDRADPRRRRRLLAGRLADRRRAAGLEGREPGRGGGLLREHHRGGEGRDRHLLHVVERGRGGRLHPARTPRCCSVPTSSWARTSDGCCNGTTSRSGAASAMCTPASMAPSCPRRPPRTRTPTSTSTPSAAAPPARCTWPRSGAVPQERIEDPVRPARWSPPQRVRRPDRCWWPPRSG